MLHPPRSCVRSRAGIILLVLVLPCTLASRAWSHPLSQGSLDVVIRPDHVDVRARLTIEEVSVTEMLTTTASGPGAGSAGASHEQHARYFAEHLHVSADGHALTPTKARVISPEPGAGGGGTSSEHITYLLEYSPSPAGVFHPHQIELMHNVLTDVEFLPGTRWEASYVVRIGQEGRPAAEGLLLTAGTPLTFACDGQALGAGGTDGSSGARVDRLRMFREYLVHGIHHILTGYDHLLFISALVLATTRLWDLLKVVTAFTLAHTLTLTLAALNWVHLPGRVVEPMIAASIVFVAVQNVIWPRRARGWGRLAAAFFFGLFHGLGFAGGLLEAMQEMPVSSKLLAIAAFSLGVELGHQMIVLPVFSGLKLARSTRAEESAKEHLSLVAQRMGSAVISLAGMFYLFVALREGFFV